MVSRPVQRLYTDVVGPMERLPLRKPRYFATTIDECSGFFLVRFISRKDEACKAVNDMVQAMGNLFHLKTWMLTCVDQNIVKWIRSDGRGEYVGHQFQNWLKQGKLSHEIATAYSAESNGRA